MVIINTKNYIDIYIKLSQQLNDYNDYADRQRVKSHNAAMVKLKALLNELKDNIPNATIILNSLLLNESEKVRLIAASHSLEININTRMAEEELLKIQKNTEDKARAFEAEMILKNWNGTKQ